MAKTREELEGIYLHKKIHIKPNAAHFKAGHIGTVTGTAETAVGIALVVDFDNTPGFIFPETNIATIIN